MHVLGGLIRLPTINDDLPLPWWHRAPLGFLTGTPAFIVLQEPANRPIGDLIVSTIDPMKWPLLRVLHCEKRDVPGVLADAFGAVPPLNIAAAEAMTTDSCRRHNITLIVEPLSFFGATVDHVSKGVDEWAAAVPDRLREKGFERPLVVTRDDIPLEWRQTGTVEGGWLRNTGWRSVALRRHPELKGSDIDLSSAVVSADTEQRLLRFVFPKKGARTVQVYHEDTPGALHAIAEQLAEADFNILSALLRRGGSRRPGKAVFLAVVEPAGLATAAGEEALQEALDAIPFKLMPDWEIRRARPPEGVIYPHHPDEIVARVPHNLLPLVRKEQSSVPKGRIPIFISHKFMPLSGPQGGRNQAVVREVRRVLEKNGFHPVEALPTPISTAPSSDEVKSKMWACRAGILLVTRFDDDSRTRATQEELISRNLAHEAGFFQGQGKPLLPLVERGAEKLLQDIANLAGLQTQTFSPDKAMIPADPDSIEGGVEEWLSALAITDESPEELVVASSSEARG